MGKEKKSAYSSLHPMVVPLTKSYMESLEEYQLHPSQLSRPIIFSPKSPV
ncbi:Integrase [Geobacillus thermoleovorans CCB_US3_UF5]|uniref:Integrase n=1 Tax=Geobacillus thermoleovorans CCB_US3_UF5 TaxID=1111068 RepID=A0ABM5MHZ0_GEOTH|nr:Integrase [Geobacillus thermoleovorans CCB_US3_UF5]GAJ58924.1 hypothetical protein B23_2145 [Geobacillus thermoleovorans B23]